MIRLCLDEWSALSLGYAAGAIYTAQIIPALVCCGAFFQCLGILGRKIISVSRYWASG
jgi:hypothetical protein